MSEPFYTGELAKATAEFLSEIERKAQAFVVPTSRGSAGQKKVVNHLGVEHKITAKSQFTLTELQKSVVMAEILGKSVGFTLI